MTTDKAQATGNEEKKATKSVWEQIAPGKAGVVTLTFGKASAGFTENDQAQLIHNCLNSIASGLMKKDDEFMPIEGGLNRLPDNTLAGWLNVYRRTPEELAAVRTKKAAGPQPG